LYQSSGKQRIRGKVCDAPIPVVLFDYWRQLALTGLE